MVKIFSFFKFLPWIDHDDGSFDASALCSDSEEAEFILRILGTIRVSISVYSLSGESRLESLYRVTTEWKTSPHSTKLEMFKIRISLLNLLRFSKISWYTPFVSNVSLPKRIFHACAPLIELVGQMSHSPVQSRKKTNNGENMFSLF